MESELLSGWMSGCRKENVVGFWLMKEGRLGLRVMKGGDNERGYPIVLNVFWSCVLLCSVLLLLALSSCLFVYHVVFVCCCLPVSSYLSVYLCLSTCVSLSVCLSVLLLFLWHQSIEK